MKVHFAIAAAMSCAALFVCAAPVQAIPVTRQVVVHYDDLNLANEAGAQQLIHRLETSASRACGGLPAAENYAAWTAYQACTKAAMQNAVTNVNHPVVNRLYGRQ